MEARGQVFNLKHAADFEGIYRQSSGAAPARTDPKALVMKNEKGVVVVLEAKVETETNPYLTLDASDHDVKVKIER
jgi:IMP cyclohydrolase